VKPLLIAGNWKSNKTTVEATQWLRTFQLAIPNVSKESTTIVLCAPYTVLGSIKWQIGASHLPIVLGAQDVSPYPDGAYTGEVSARIVKDVADWVIIGHSERRKNFGETDEMLAQKVIQAKTAGLKIIFCVPDAQTVVPEGVDAVGYEPVWAIGTGKSDTPENANDVIATIKAKSQVRTVIYGGSVTPENVASFVAQPAIDGVLPGGASLDAEKFARLCLAAVGK